MYCTDRLHFLLEVGFCHVRAKDSDELGDLVDVVPQTNGKLTIKNKKNRTILSATMKILPTLATHGVFGMLLLCPHGVNVLVQG